MANRTLSTVEVTGLIKKYGSPSLTTSQLVTALAVAYAESGFQTQPKDNVNGDGSRDRGLWQINNKWHSSLSDVDAYDPVKATQYAAKISSGFTDMGL